MRLSVAAVVPVIDEQASIGDVVRGLLAAGACCVFVVDGGSREGTQAAALGAGAIVIDELRRGYGRACLTGAALASEVVAGGHEHDALAFLDGDGSCDPEDLPQLVDAVSDADVALGVRPGRMIEAGAMPWHARLGNRLVAGILSARSGRVVRDLPPFKVIRRLTLEQLDLDDERYGWTVQLVARALREPSVRLREVPVAFRVRRGGTSKVSGSWRGSIAAGRGMLGVGIRETGSRPLVALMTKAPGSPTAKTRLAIELGQDLTAAFWAACLGDTAASARLASREAGASSFVMLARQADARAVAQIVGPGWTPLVQARPGLAAALAEVFLAAFDRGADRAVAVAGDALGLPPSSIGAAAAALDGSVGAAVLGPTSDGGYHLVGLRWRRAPRWWPARLRALMRGRLDRRLRLAFAEVTMGGTSALEAVSRDLAAAGWHVRLVDPWPDIDTLADLRARAGDLAADARWAPRTAAWLGRHDALINHGRDRAASRARDGGPHNSSPPGSALQDDRQCHRHEDQQRP